MEYPSIRVSKDKLLNVLPKKRTIWMEPEKNMTEKLQEIRYGKSLWRTFLIAAIILMFLESIIGRVKPENMKNLSG